MARCNSCNKFVSYEEAEPEVDSLEVDDQGHVTANVRITNNCAECGDELREATLEMESDHSAEVDEHKEETGIDPELEINEEGSDRTQRSEGKGRGLTTFYGAKVDYRITCKCSWCEAHEAEAFSVEGSLEDDVQASSMDEC